MPASTHVTRYNPDTPPTVRPGRVYIFDASTDRIIGELTGEVADMIRQHVAGTLDYDGEMITLARRLHVVHASPPQRGGGTNTKDPMTTDEPTACAIQPCHTGPAHVVLFAQPGPFHGHTYRAGQRVFACLMHGGQILDAHKDPHLAPRWLQPHLGQLPNAALPDARPVTVLPRPRPWKAPQRERRAHA